MQTPSYASIVRAAIALTQVEILLSRSEAVILERIRRGAGATEWYYCRDRHMLQTVEEQLSPGSAVSFYFDGRIQKTLYSPELRPHMERIIAETRDVVIGVLCGDQLHIDVEYGDNPQNLAEITSRFDSTTEIFYGPFPGRDNDGVRAVSLVLPDEDGIKRLHPH